MVYPFGWGLSLTTFSLSVSGAPSTLALPTGCTATPLNFSVTVTNTGKSITGDEVVFVYFKPKSLSQQPASRLIKQLIDFERVHLAPQQATTITFSIPVPNAVQVVDKATGDFVSTPGVYDIIITNGVDPEFAVTTVTLSGPQTVCVPFPGSV